MHRLFLTVTVLGVVAALIAPLVGHAQSGFDPGRATFSISVNDEVYPYREFATFVLPRERLDLAVQEGGSQTYTLQADGGRVIATSPGRWAWSAPGEPGLRELTFTRMAPDAESVLLRVFVKVPLSRVRDGLLDGYPIGEYPPVGGRADIYSPPNGFIVARQEDLWLPVSPHFVLGQFISDPSEANPKYLVLRERLVLKLEALLERVNDRGYAAVSFGIVSGYRTPLFNESIGGTPYSRHIYGGAAGIIIDRSPRDGLIDDLDGDGRVGDGDAQVLFDLADQLFREPGMAYLAGGLSVYKSTPWRGPYLHVDVRGYRARWDSDDDPQRLPEPIEPRHLRDFPPPGRTAALR